MDLNLCLCLRVWVGTQIVEVTMQTYCMSTCECCYWMHHSIEKRRGWLKDHTALSWIAKSGPCEKLRIGMWKCMSVRSTVAIHCWEYPDILRGSTPKLCGPHGGGWRNLDCLGRSIADMLIISRTSVKSSWLYISWTCWKYRLGRWILKGGVCLHRIFVPTPEKPLSPLLLGTSFPKSLQAI